MVFEESLFNSTEKLLFAIEKVSEGGKKQEEGGINLLELAKSAIGLAKELGLKNLTGGLLGGK